MSEEIEVRLVDGHLVPTTKGAAIEDVLNAMFSRTESITSSRCIPAPTGCGREIPSAEIEGWSSITVKEYRISGLCRTCQDTVFADPNECLGCLTAYDIGLDEYGNMIAYPHPDCPVHGEGRS